MLIRSEGSGQTHPLVPVGPPVQWGAGCLSSFLGLWGHLGQWVYTEVRQKGKSLLTEDDRNVPPKHFLYCQVIILASAVKKFKSQAHYADSLTQNTDDIELIACMAGLAFISRDVAWLTRLQNRTQWTPCCRFIMIRQLRSTPNLMEVWKKDVSRWGCRYHQLTGR